MDYSKSRGKNIPCRFYANGSCNKGNKCDFLHEKGQPRSFPNPNSGPRREGPQGNNSNKDYGRGKPTGGNVQDSGPRICERYFEGNCSYGDKCRFMHDFTSDKDLTRTYKGPLGGEQELGSSYGVVGICKIPIPNTPEFIIIFAQLHSIKGLKISVHGKMEPISVLNFEAHETITCVRYLGGKLVYCLYFETTGTSDIRITNLETYQVESQISPAHERQIIGLELFNTSLISVSRDGKVKFWGVSGTSFAILNSYPLEGTPSYFKAGILMEKPVLLIGSEEGSLDILAVVQGEDGNIHASPFTCIKSLHSKAITCISIFANTVLTSSLDGLMKVTDNSGTQDTKFKRPIRHFHILKNRRDEDILAIGYDNGSVELRKISDTNKIHGTLPHSKTAGISTIEDISYRINDINFCIMLLGDMQGEVSLWTFK